MPSDKQPKPYADAPRMPEGELVFPGDFLSSRGAVELEIGPGRGGFILERLETDSEVRIFALEIKRKWASIVDRKISERGYSGRGRVFFEDARLALPRIKPASLSRIFVHFPDPWWKKRHQKRLLATDDLADHAARLLIPGGEFFAQTDVEDRAERYHSVFDRHPEFFSVTAEKYAPDANFGARSPRERRAMDDQLPVYRVRFLRR